MARSVADRAGLSVSVKPQGELRHERVLDLFASAKILVGLSLSDGIGTALLDSMAMGVIPVQGLLAVMRGLANPVSRSTKSQLMR